MLEYVNTKSRIEYYIGTQTVNSPYLSHLVIFNYITYLFGLIVIMTMIK